MEYYGIYGSNNDYRNYLAHYGRKGMKWGKNIFGDESQDRAYARNRERATADINDAKKRMQAHARLTGKSTTLGGNIKSGIRTAGAAVEYGALVAERAVADAARATSKFVRKAGRAVIDAGKKAWEGIKSFFKDPIGNLKKAAKSVYDKGKNLLDKVTGGPQKRGQEQQHKREVASYENQIRKDMAKTMTNASAGKSGDSLVAAQKMYEKLLKKGGAEAEAARNVYSELMSNKALQKSQQNQRNSDRQREIEYKKKKDQFRYNNAGRDVF